MRFSRSVKFDLLTIAVAVFISLFTPLVCLAEERLECPENRKQVEKKGDLFSKEALSPIAENERFDTVRSFLWGERVDRILYCVFEGKEGVWDGPYLAFARGNVFLAKGAYENGQPSGAWRKYYSNGNLETEIEYVGGVQKRRVDWNKDGSLESTSGCQQDECRVLRKQGLDNARAFYASKLKNANNESALAEIHFDFAEMLADEKLFDEAVENYHKYEKLAGERAFREFDRAVVFAKALIKTGDFNEAEKKSQLALRYAKEARGFMNKPMSGQWQEIRSTLGENFYKQGRFEEAYDEFRKVLWLVLNEDRDTTHAKIKLYKWLCLTTKDMNLLAEARAYCSLGLEAIAELKKDPGWSSQCYYAGCEDLEKIANEIGASTSAAPQLPDGATIAPEEASAVMDEDSGASDGILVFGFTLASVIGVPLGIFLVVRANLKEQKRGLLFYIACIGIPMGLVVTALVLFYRLFSNAFS